MSAAYSSPIDIHLPAQPLDISLKQLADTAGMSIAFDSAVASGKTAPAIHGRMLRSEALNQLLMGSGLNAKIDGETAVVKAVYDPNAVRIKLNEVTVRARRYQNVGPLPGLNLTKDQIAGNIQSISAKEIKEAHSLSLSDLLNSKLQSINVNDYQGNPFQMDVTYRGFTASPQIGTPQGLSVFFDGIRVNEPFGDVVNWDMLPMNALDSFDIFPGSNPLFGLNTLGGALSMKTKSGFTSAGVSAEILTGSFGRKQLQASGGINNANQEQGSWDVGDFAAFGAVNLFLEDGWRKNSPSDVNQAFGKLEWQGERASLAFSTLGVINKLVGNGTIPQEFYREDPKSVFTSPDKTDNTLLQFQLSGIFDVTDTFNITGMVYNRKSNRHANTGDVIDIESFQPSGTYVHDATRLPGEGKNIHCGYADDNKDGIPNYFVVKENQYNDFINSVYAGTPDMSYTVPEGAITPELTAALHTVLAKPVYDVFVNPFVQPTPTLPMGVGTLSSFFDFPNGNTEGVQFIDTDGTTSRVFANEPLNASVCNTGLFVPNGRWNQGMIPSVPNRSRDGALDDGPGVVKGTPTAIITDTDIKQSTKGAALQFNWNFDQHKFMVGASIDKAYASYVGKQRLGIMDNNRNVFSDPSQIGEEYYFSSHDATVNDFAGTSTTKSVYFSETWTPTQTLNLSFSGRYNYTNVVNKLAPTRAERNLTSLRALNRYAFGIICPGSDLSNCPYSLDGPIPGDIYFNELMDNSNGLRSSYDGINLLENSATEKFRFHSLNPSIGGTWQAKPNLNLYANWNQGTRTPSVIELGCAYDGTLVPWSVDPNQLFPRSLLEGRGCKLPSSLSGDPFLPQVVAQTAEVGARGKFNEFIEWNLSAYRTNVKDDIYMTSVGNDLSFFQSIGDTRRQGIEFGMAGAYGKSDFRINYSLTEATFQSYFKTFASANSTRALSGQFLNQIQVQPGNVMPGVPFNNFNFSWGYKLTPKLKMNWNVVAHSGSFLRGNENNAHTPSPGRMTSTGSGQTLPNEYSGTAPGYAVLNFNARYDLGKGWGASILVNNVLDKKYYTAGRLGNNPFAPSVIGAIGPGGFNYNSNEWISSQFISPGAPRGVWVTLSYDFEASRKTEPLPSRITEVEPDRTEMVTPKPPSPEALAVAKALDNMKSLPVLTNRKQANAATKVAEQEVKAQLEVWRNALARNDADALVKAYRPDFSPEGSSHQEWQEQQKLRAVSNAVQDAEVRDLVVVPQGMRMLAIFTHSISSNQQSSQQRKVMTFEQKDGLWLITNEHNLPVANEASTSPGRLKQSAIDTGSRDLSQQILISRHRRYPSNMDRLAQVEGK